jgi:hypothetical protein
MRVIKRLLFTSIYLLKTLLLAIFNIIISDGLTSQFSRLFGLFCSWRLVVKKPDQAAIGKFHTQFATATEIYSEVGYLIKYISPRKLKLQL